MLRAYMFPGQGSQVRGMAADLIAAFPSLVAMADEVLGFSIAKICADDPLGQLDDTRFTQPILYIVNALHLLKCRENGDAEPDVLLGHSLGEFNALHAAGCFSLEDGLKLVKQRGEFFANAPEGGMAAVLGVEEEQLREFLASNDLDMLDIAGLNTPSQVVIAGERDDLARATAALNAANITAMSLKTSGAFHSRRMAIARDRFASVLADQPLKPPAIPVIANVSARPHRADTLRQSMVDQITQPVRWCDSVQFLLANGVTEFVEVGHGSVLETLVRHIRRETDLSQLPATPGALECSAAPEITASVASGHVTSGKRRCFDQVDAWNAKHGRGTEVRWRHAPNTTFLTRSEAIVLFGHRAGLYVEGLEGYFDLEDLAPAAPPS